MSRFVAARAYRAHTLQSCVPRSGPGRAKRHAAVAPSIGGAVGSLHRSKLDPRYLRTDPYLPLSCTLRFAEEKRRLLEQERRRTEELERTLEKGPSADGLPGESPGEGTLERGLSRGDPGELERGP